MIGEGPNPNGNGAQTTDPVQAMAVAVRRAQETPATLAGDNGEIVRLTRSQRRVLAVISDPALSEATNADKAKAACVSENQFYLVMRTPAFVRYWRQHVANSVQSRVQRYIDAADATAAKPGRDGFNDRRLLLEMSGHYTPRQQTDVTSGGEPIVGVIGVDIGGV